MTAGEVSSLALVFVLKIAAEGAQVVESFEPWLTLQFGGAPSTHSPVLAAENRSQCS